MTLTCSGNHTPMATNITVDDPQPAWDSTHAFQVLRRLVAQWLGSSMSALGLGLVAAAAILAIAVR
jgi:hypothetical protein